MNCDHARELLTAYVDSELDVLHCIEIEDHLATCDECSRVVKMQQSIHSAFQANSPIFQPPADLASRVTAQLTAGSPVIKTAPPKSWIAKPSTWIAAAAAIIFAVFAVREIPRPAAPGDLIAQEIFDSHLRSLQPGHLTDVESSDRHTVKPWFNGKVDFSPPVFDLTDEGFPLIGGRLESIEGHPVAALVYRRARHEISLYLWPDSEAISGATHVQQGYNMLQWNDRGFCWWLVSDLNLSELEQLESKLKAAR